jgi:hypothetical protein
MLLALKFIKIEAGQGWHLSRVAKRGVLIP